MDVTQPTLHVRIDELVLDGVEPGDRLIAQALRRAIESSIQTTSSQTAARTADAVARALKERED